MPIESVRPIRKPLHTQLTPVEAARCFRGDPQPFALIGSWAGGGALLGSQPIRVLDEDADPFHALTRSPVVEGDVRHLVGGGWFGYLGYGLGRKIETLTPPPPRPVPMPPFSLAFYDHLVRFDATDGRWWFEALWSPQRAAALEERFQVICARLGAPAPPRQHSVCTGFVPTPHRDRHLSAVTRAIDYILAGAAFQVNLCIRLESCFTGDPLDLFCSGAQTLVPPFAGYVAGTWGALASLSPELFLRRSGRRVTTAPIKGTCARPSVTPALDKRERLLASPKNVAENVMIVDLMRNDLGRVCTPGSIHVPALARAEPHPGVWHLVSEVTGELRRDVDDDTLLRATFPPGSVTGAPKIKAMDLISELETTAREAYTGAIGYVSPVAGVELNVAIRTFEFADGRAWLGAGGGIVADSDPAAEWEECLMKAQPLLRSVGAEMNMQAVGNLDVGAAI
ncbi:MAG: aminodeoxychorismate synthase component I [Actinomycetota bacterium]|nr:aminodeoxychorismate synthase component I [Actinomycetota bacterium]